MRLGNQQHTFFKCHPLLKVASQQITLTIMNEVIPNAKVFQLCKTTGTFFLMAGDSNACYS